MHDVEQFLESHRIQYIPHEHPAVYTCEEADKFCGDIPGMACKNLFLKDKKSERYFLVILPSNKRADLKKIGTAVGTSQITFADPEALKEILGLETGAVSPFGLINDKNKKVELYLDQEVDDADIVSFHPNRNTATLELTREMFQKFLRTVECKIHVIML